MSLCKVLLFPDLKGTLPAAGGAVPPGAPGVCAGLASGHQDAGTAMDRNVP